MLEHRWYTGYITGDAKLIETIHIILSDVLEAKGAEAIDPAVYLLIHPSMSRTGRNGARTCYSSDWRHR